MICPYQNLAKPTMKFCEENLCSYITAPANTWSNLTYVFVGIYLIFIRLKSNNLLLRLIGPLAIICGLSSGIYHATFTHFSQTFDNGAMFLFSSLLIVMNLNRMKIKSLSVSKLILLYIVLNVISLMIFCFQKKLFGINVGITIFAIQLLAVVITEYYCNKKAEAKYKFNNLIVAFVILFVAWSFWWLDFLKVWCNPATAHFINGHAVWHILSSISFIFVYRFYAQFFKEESFSPGVYQIN